MLADSRLIVTDMLDLTLVQHTQLTEQWHSGAATYYFMKG